MILPYRFLLAFVALAAVDGILGPESPQNADPALAVFSLSVALFLSYYAIVILCDVCSKRSAGFTLRALRFFVSTRHVLPLVYWVALLFVARWDAWVDYRFASSGLTITSAVLLVPFFVYEGLALLGEFLLHGRVGAAGDRWRSTLFLAPMLFLLTGVFDALSAFDWSRAAVYEIGVARDFVWVAAFALLFLVLPLWFARVYGARRLLPASLHAEFVDLASAARVGVARVLEWPTSARSLNALLVGPFRWTRTVLFTDLILARFSREQLRAVFAHELGHARRRHVLRTLLFFVALPLLASRIVLDAYVAWEAGDAAGAVAAPSEWTWMAVLLACFAVLAWPFSRLRRRFEHEADLEGAALLGDESAMIAALRQVEFAMPKAAKRGSLMHPSTTRRIELLELASSDKSRIARWRRSSFFAQVALGALLAIALAFYVPMSVADFERDIPGYLLARGRPQAAIQAYGQQGDMQPERRARGIDQAQRAVRIAYGEDAPSVRVLRQRAVSRGRRALRCEDFEAVRGWFGLARRLGSEDPLVTAVARFLDAEASGDERARHRELYWIRSLEVPPRLRRALAKLLAAA